MNRAIRNIESNDDEINLWELLEHLKSGWKWIAAGGAIGTVSAIVLALSLPAQYEATVVIQPARIGMIVAAPSAMTAATTAATATTATTATTAVEPVGQTLERLKQVTFYRDAIVKACEAESAKDLTNSVKVNLVKGNNMLSISYRAETPALANACMNEIVSRLTQSQAAIAAPLIKELLDQQTTTKQLIDIAERFLAIEEKRGSSSSTLNELSALMMLKREDLTKLQKLYREQRIQLTEPLTQPMKLLEPIYVPEKPVAPKKLTIVAGGVIAGMLIGLFALFANRSWRRYKRAATLT